MIDRSNRSDDGWTRPPSRRRRGAGLPWLLVGIVVVVVVLWAVL